jgi:hypothetical protein
MPELLKGRISDIEGLREVLEIIETFKEVNSSVLEIETPSLSGKIGIAWGRFITGASLLEHGAEEDQKGRKVLRRLLRLREGKFRFIDLEGEPVEDLRQSLGVDLHRTSTVVPGLDYREAHFLYELSETPDADSEPAPGADLPAATASPQQPDFNRFMDDFANTLDVNLKEPVAAKPAPTPTPEPAPAPPNVTVPPPEMQFISEPQFKETTDGPNSAPITLPDASLEDLIHSQSQTVSPEDAVVENVAQVLSTPLDSVFGGPMPLLTPPFPNAPVDHEETQPMVPMPQPDVPTGNLRSQWTGQNSMPQQRAAGADGPSALQGFGADGPSALQEQQPTEDILKQLEQIPTPENAPQAQAPGGLRSKFTTKSNTNSPFVHPHSQTPPNAEQQAPLTSEHNKPAPNTAPPDVFAKEPITPETSLNRRQIPFLRMTAEENKPVEDKTLTEPIKAVKPPSPPPAPAPAMKNTASDAPAKKTPLLKPGVIAGPSLSADQVVQAQPRLRPKPATNNDAVGIAIFCVLFFVVSCAGTVIFGPKAWAIITSLLHLQ